VESCFPIERRLTRVTPMQSSVLSYLKRSLPAPVRTLASRPQDAWRALRGLQWLGGISPRLKEELQRRRQERFLHWLQEHLPDSHFRLMTPDLDDRVRRTIIDDLSTCSYVSLVSPIGPTKRIVTDVIYVNFTSTPDALKDIISLRRVDSRLHCTLLASAASPHSEVRQGRFDRVEFWSNHIDLAHQLMSAKARAVIAAKRGGMMFSTVVARLFWRGRFVYRPYPFSHRDSDSIAPVNHLLAEKFILRNVDAVCHFFFGSAIDFLRRETGMTCQAVRVLPGCMPEFEPEQPLPKLSASDHCLHIAYAAGVPQRGQPVAGYLCDFMDNCRLIVSQRIHLYLFPSWLDPSSLHPDLQILSRESSYFHLEDRLPYDQLVRRLTQYDWGLYHFRLDNYPIREGFREFASNGFFTYLQAGLPVITSASTPTYSKIVAEDGVGIVLGDNEFPRLSERLNAFDHEKLPMRIQRVKRRYGPDHVALYRAVFGDKSRGAGSPVGEVGVTGQSVDE